MVIMKMRRTAGTITVMMVMIMMMMPITAMIDADDDKEHDACAALSPIAQHVPLSATVIAFAALVSTGHICAHLSPQDTLHLALAWLVLTAQLAHRCQPNSFSATWWLP